MFHIILFEPEIPPNTGNIVRLSANTGAALHLIKPLGFNIDDRSMRRAGLDYAEYASMQVHDSWPDCQSALGPRRIFAMTTKGSLRFDIPRYQAGDAFFFGPETRGLPADLLAEFAPEARIRLPMVAGNRSLNLSNAVAVTIYEAWRQAGFSGGA